MARRVRARTLSRLGLSVRVRTHHEESRRLSAVLAADHVSPSRTEPPRLLCALAYGSSFCRVWSAWASVSWVLYASATRCRKKCATRACCFLGRRKYSGSQHAAEKI